MKYTAFTAAALLASQALALDLDLDLRTEVGTTLDGFLTIDQYAPTFFSQCDAYDHDVTYWDDNLLMDCRCVAWYWDEWTYEESSDCLINTDPNYTQISFDHEPHTYTGGDDDVFMDSILDGANSWKDKWIVKDLEAPYTAQIQFDFGTVGNPASRVVTGVGIQTTSKYNRDPAYVDISYLKLGFEDAEINWVKLDTITLDWAEDERYTEHKFALQDFGADAPETTAMRFEFTAKDGADEIAVQQLKWYGISRQKALFHEYGGHCQTLLYYRDDPDCVAPAVNGEGGECGDSNLTEDQIFDLMPLLIYPSVLNRDQFDAYIGFCEEFAVELQSQIDAENISVSLDSTTAAFVYALQNTADDVVSGLNNAASTISSWF